MWLNMNEPTILNLSSTSWPNISAVVNEPSGNATWVYMIVTAPSKPPKRAPKTTGFFPVAHPVRLLMP
jgi:hypothetical protein